MKPKTNLITLNFEHTYAEKLPGFSMPVLPTPVQRPSLLQFNESLADELGLDLETLTLESVPKVFSGNELPSDANPIAQAYAGHQFGNFVPQLGDGRAMLLGEVIDRRNQRRDIALKGSGRTPFSRGGDGKAAVGPVLREYLIGEAMHALGIPTTRALAAVATGESVIRERPLPGAVLTRVADSHIRVGTFQFFAARRQFGHVEKLADYVIGRHYPELLEDSGRYLSLLRCVIDRQAHLVAEWMLVGFIHGVMNTDNMTVSGETIDYGPCAFMESYVPETVFSSIDRDGRYAYSNQPAIAVWNLSRFAETLLPLLDENEERAVAIATETLETFKPTFESYWYRGASKKLGLIAPDEETKVSESDRHLIDAWFELLTKSKVDHTLAHRRLAELAEGNECAFRSLFNLNDANGKLAELDDWLQGWSKRQEGAVTTKLASDLRSANPVYIPRNHLVEEALSAASDNGDLTPFEHLLSAVQNPFEEVASQARFAVPASAEFTANYQTFCGT